MRLIYRCVSIIVGGILGISCSRTINEPVEYGVPYATYKFDGTIVAAATGDPIPGIEIRYRNEEPVRSAGDGSWAIDLTASGACGIGGWEPCSLRVEDVDGPDNGGSYRTKSIALEPTQTEPGDDWFYGTFEQHDIEIEMEEE